MLEDVDQYVDTHNCSFSSTCGTHH